jgi:hypothetical protein
VTLCGFLQQALRRVGCAAGLSAIDKLEARQQACRASKVIARYPQRAGKRAASAVAGVGPAAALRGGAGMAERRGRPAQMMVVMRCRLRHVERANSFGAHAAALHAPASAPSASTEQRCEVISSKAKPETCVSVWLINSCTGRAAAT